MPRPSPALVVATLALVAAIGQPVYAATVAKDSVGTLQVRDGGIKVVDLARGSVNSDKVVDKTLKGADLATGSITDRTIRDGSILPADLAPALRSKVQVGGWTYLNGSVMALTNDVNAPTPMGSLSGDGTGPITTAGPASLVVTGRLIAQAIPLGTYKSVNCRFAVDGAAVGSYSNAFEEYQGVVPVSALVPVAAGPHDVSLSCYGSGLAGGVDVSVLAVPS